MDSDGLHVVGSEALGSFIGQPDLSVITATELANTVGMMVNVSDRFVIADTDANTELGDPLIIVSTITLYEGAGVAGCQIENQTFRMCVQYPANQGLISNDQGMG